MPRWIPDTCSSPPCAVIVREDWSGADRFEVKCSRHAAMDDVTAFTAIRNENTQKNQIAAFVMAREPQYFGSFSQDDQGTIVRIVLPSVIDQVNLQNALNAQFGAGVVRLAFLPVSAPRTATGG